MTIEHLGHYDYILLDINVEMNKIETIAKIETAATESTLSLFIVIRSIFVGICCLYDKL